MAQQTDHIGDANKMVTMKLYTEEQVREILKSTHIHTDNDVDMILPQFTPIELPSDEDIYSVLRGKKMFEKDWEFIKGAKWMKEQILNQNK